MSVELAFFNESQLNDIPEQQQFEKWIQLALPLDSHCELALRIIDEDEMVRLNQQFRNRKGTTNVLSFPAQIPEGVDLPLLGDIIICAPVVLHEAKQQQKMIVHHFAHLAIHGTLHLLGHDHHEPKDAQIMEQREVDIMEKLGFPNPYTEVK